MSTAIYPLGMESYNNRVNMGGYVSWKGAKNNSNPVGIQSTHIRPLTNNDPGNAFPTGFGLPRPIKHYRKGRVIPDLQKYNDPLVEYNLNRHVRSSIGSSLGGGGGGSGVISQLIDTPGNFIVTPNTNTEINENTKANLNCKTCQGGSLVTNFYPNKTYLTENPETVSTQPNFCCNEERKARRRVLPTNTNLSKSYYTTLQQYRENRCQTYDQRVFNFKSNHSLNDFKPGSPLGIYNTFVANCYPNGEIEETTVIHFMNKIIQELLKQDIIQHSDFNNYIEQNIYNLTDFVAFLNTLTNSAEAISVYNAYISNPYFGMPLAGLLQPFACKLVVYKPNNYQYATQGAVSSSSRILRLNVNTIQTNLAGYKKDQIREVNYYQKNNQYNQEGILNPSGQPVVPFLYKNKVQGCNQEIQYHFQNHRSCTNANPTGFPTQSPFRSNHYAQSPVNPLM